MDSQINATLSKYLNYLQGLKGLKSNPAFTNFREPVKQTLTQQGSLQQLVKSPSEVLIRPTVDQVVEVKQGNFQVKSTRQITKEEFERIK